MSSIRVRALTLTILCAGAAAPGLSAAAERFQLRHNLAGTLPGELVAIPASSGWVGSMTYTHSNVHKVTGADGERLNLAIPGGVVPLPAPAPAALYPTYPATTASVDFRARLRQVNLSLSYATEARPTTGRFVVGANLPYLQREQTTRLQAQTPALSWRPGVPAATQAAVGSSFNQSYQAGLAAQAAAESGEISGFGDAEVYGGWIAPESPVRLAATAALVVPTGRYDAAAGVDAGQGDFFTFKPSVRAAWQLDEKLVTAGKLVFGFNSRNRDTNVRSGHWAGFEAAVAYRLPIALVGVNGVHVQQLRDDDNNPFGASRFRATSAGLFITSELPAIGSLTFQYTAMLESRNARHGNVTQLRLTRAF
ncbi:transporter [Ramlibacter sp. AW1]|uniref:Transporter n=1 Tax=Ramlibacter aurantiacus TaxID=2801330 RepID=A0A936ZL14_9BURK|nr:transporter [Ramlibacter aurantiacus]MBL0422158.1 transporter [Ramlibacter aurantiacus]